MTHKVLIVDDDPTSLRLIAAALEDGGYASIQAKSGADALQLLESPDRCGIDAVILDLNMPEIDGFEVLEKVHPRHPKLPIIVLTAHGSVSNAVQSMRAGAVDFLIKQPSANRIRTAVENALDQSLPGDELRPLTEKLSAELTFDQLVGRSSAMRDAIKVARKAATSNIPVLIEGESGVGKELFARAIHAASPRSDLPLVTVNCGAIPANLVESILFGHEKGAFTGATTRHTGKFLEADGGTIFLDEVGELPLDAQVKLLRVLQEGEIDPIGGREPIAVDVRVISATNRILADEVRAGRFREDLYYRLAVFPVRIPPLRKRPEDIPDLVHHFIARFGESEEVEIKSASEAALNLLKGFSWPGNVRQLQNAVFRAAVLSDHERLEPEDFPSLLLQALDGGEDKEEDTPAAASPGWSGSLPVLDEEGHVRTLADIEADMIKFALSRYNGRMSEIARRLGIGRSTLYRKVADLDLDSEDEADVDDAPISANSISSERGSHEWSNQKL